ncbi:MAG TPA: thiosulfate sulfurtransferase GlpE [Nitrospina sp.]|jgi:thiosulfate sulfurtransferase|nr:thiosulfate sulfurtransferase GlpE [Nitrospinaceae bacterium]HBP11987.1 thiosulfate sulfurtransferase GlpE [Nitrospina sp.]HCK68913.1 thiosulfate sulfurtransferase GlpE [Nitrospina sp.]|tara:strand:+ start:78 stop:368 length:291 start_codon:yes stop_codon:yes gene_type:complete
MFKELDPHKAQEMVEEGSVNVIDIRDPGSYSAGHIPSAVSLNDTNVKEFIESTDKEKPLIVYCYHGISSRGAAEYLSQNGFKEVYSMTGGFEAWPD